MNAKKRAESLRRRGAGVLAAVLLLGLLTPLAHGAESTVYIRSEEDLDALSQNCVLDSWSRGKTVSLETDLDLNGRAFSPIPTFGGTFQGNGHTIVGLELTGSGDVRGLFRYIQAGATVQDLHVAGRIQPEEEWSGLGLLAGQNEGTIRNCTGSGTIQGGNRIGGLVGSNETGGELVACSFTGTVRGVHSVGGIAGENRGTLTRCENAGQVNTSDLADRPQVSGTGSDRFNASEDRPVYQDIGGVAGRSQGSIQSCRNSGDVGYDLMGYHIGGIAGRQSGYLDGCTNTGTIKGQKGVGGIVGQLEPAVAVAYSQDFLDRLLVELDNMGALMDRTADDADRISHSVSQQLDQIAQQTRTSKDLAGKLADAMTDWANGGIDQVNELSARLSWTMDQLVPITEELVESLDDLKGVIDALERVRKDLYDPLEEGVAAVEELDAALADLQLASTRLQTANKAVQKAVEQLQEDLTNGNTGALSEDLEELIEALEQFEPVYDALSQGLEHLRETLEELQEVGRGLENALDDLERVHKQTRTALDSLSEVAEAAHALVSDLSERPDITMDPIGPDITETGDALQESLDALLDSGDALNALLSSSSDELVEDLRALTAQLRAITSLIRSEKSSWSSDRSQGVEEVVKSHFQDISDQCDPAREHDGRLSSSTNQGAVSGKTQVGGIVGSVGIETDFDVEEDLTRVGEYSMDFQYQAKAFLVGCVNTGTVTAKKDYAGGLAGKALLGQITGGESYGPVSSTGGSCVGGIAGASAGSIRKSWARCDLSGSERVGGVAGEGSTLQDCHTLVRILSGEACLGGIAGQVDGEGTVSGNTFTHESLGAIDGISYAGRAEGVSFDSLCSTAGVPKAFSQLELTFRADGRVLAVVPFQYGRGVESLPEIPAKKGCSAAWPELDYRHLTASQTLDAIYTPYTSSLAVDGELPEVLVDGSFSVNATVEHTTEEVTWSDERGEHRATAHTVTVTDPDLREISYRVHYRLPEGDGRYTVYRLTKEGAWELMDSTVDGSYLLFDSQGEQLTFRLQKEPERVLSWWLALPLVGLLLLAVLLFRRSHPKLRGRKRSVTPPTLEGEDTT